MTRSNPLDSRNYRNKMAGRPPGAKVSNPLVRLGDAHARPRNQMATETGRLGLVYRSLEDGENLIESAESLIGMINEAVPPPPAAPISTRPAPVRRSTGPARPGTAAARRK